MAATGEGEEETVEYESDPEETKLSLKMRRREASDDEEEEEEDEREGGREGDEEEDEREKSEANRGSDGESDGQGAAAEYDEDGEEYYDEEEVRVGGEEGKGEVEGERENGGETKEEEEEEGKGEGEGGEEVEKKESEPFSVPTSGAFYMHDDRFRDNAGGRHRRTFGGRNLWESKDDRKWGHDKFEELNVQERRYEEGRRSSRGYFRGRGRGRGAVTAHARGGRMRGYSGNGNQSPPPKDVRGRGPRRYQPSLKNKNETLPAQHKQSARSFDKSSHAGSGRTTASATNSNLDHGAAPAKKIGSNLSSASPPFYPSASSNKDIALTSKKEVQAGSHNKNIRPSGMDHNFSGPLSNPLARGKNVVDATGMDKLRVDDSVSPTSNKPLNNVHMRSSASSSPIANQLNNARGQGRGVTPIGSAFFQSPQANSAVKKSSYQPVQANQRGPTQIPVQPASQALSQQLVQRSLGDSQDSSPPKAGNGALQGTGRGSLVYGGAQAVGSSGNVGSGHGDPNMPAFFPVMQFGGQHPGGMGVPAVGMAFPGCVPPPNGLGNSEMTWLPVLASAAGALGASYCPPYLPVDGNYHPRPTGQTSALPAPSKDSNLGKPNEVKPQQRPEVANDEFNQRQNKPRRYSEMNFSQ